MGLGAANGLFDVAPGLLSDAEPERTVLLDVGTQLTLLGKRAEELGPADLAADAAREMPQPRTAQVCALARRTKRRRLESVTRSWPTSRRGTWTIER
jgi:hypothetical protein